MSESHWGGTGLKRTALGVLGTIALGMGIIALFAWSPWKEPSEAEWLGGYRAWSDGIDALLQTGLDVAREDCETTFDDDVGEPPRERLQPVAAAARRGCATLTPAGWRNGKGDVVRALVDAHDDVSPPRRRRDLAALALAGVGVRTEVYCWQAPGWAPFAEQYAIVRGGEETSLRGIADGTESRVDLDPGVCAALRFYLRRQRPDPLSYENFELAEALMILTHQAEHVKSPNASEAEVECYAVQHVRPLVRDAGWEAAYASEMALQAWELSYLKLPPAFRTPACRDGGPLDRNPRSSAWP